VKEKQRKRGRPRKAALTNNEDAPVIKEKLILDDALDSINLANDSEDLDAQPLHLRKITQIFYPRSRTLRKKEKPNQPKLKRLKSASTRITVFPLGK
jgi:hypothetical protein